MGSAGASVSASVGASVGASVAGSVHGEQSTFCGQSQTPIAGLNRVPGAQFCSGVGLPCAHM